MFNGKSRLTFRFLNQNSTEPSVILVETVRF